MIFGKETETLEFKKTTGELKEAVISVSSILNKHGAGELYFGIKNDGTVLGQQIGDATLRDVSKALSDNLKPQIFPTIKEVKIYDKPCIYISFDGDSQPYYAYGRAYIRVADEDKQMSPSELEEFIIRKHKQVSEWDSLVSKYKYSDLTFSMLEAEYKQITKSDLTLKEFVSFGLCNTEGFLTNAGILFANKNPLLQSRVFCTHWDGLRKGSVGDDAIDSEEFEGDLISLLKNSNNFIRLNSKVRWKKMPDHRVNKPDYSRRAVFEALCNALMHRDWSVVGSEVHIDMYHDRLEIYSPGGMPDGTLIQERDIDDIPSSRRNPIIADVFHRLDYVERRGSGIGLIRTETSYLHGYKDEYAPEFRSTPTTFHVVLRNVNYQPDNELNNIDEEATGQVTGQDTGQVAGQDIGQDTGQVATHEAAHFAIHAAEREKMLLDFCEIARTRNEMQEFLKISSRAHFVESLLTPLLNDGKLHMTIPDRPNSRHQKYIARSGDGDILQE